MTPARENFERAARKDEREKLLKKLSTFEIWLEGYMDTGYEGSKRELQEIKRHLAKVRQGGE